MVRSEYFDHRNELDTEIALRANMQGLDWLIRDYNEPGSAGKKPLKAKEVTKDVPLTKSSTIDINRLPIDLAANPYYGSYVNRERIYDFYARQALRREKPETFPGLDGGYQGHWGNQNDQETWKDGRIKEMDHGSMVSGVFRGNGLTIPRAISVRLTSENGVPYNVVFDTDKMKFSAAWTGELVSWSDVRRGFMQGIPMEAKQLNSEILKSKLQELNFMESIETGNVLFLLGRYLGVADITLEQRLLRME